VNPHYFSAYFNKADVYIYLNKLNEAIGVYSELLQKDNANTRH